MALRRKEKEQYYFQPQQDGFEAQETYVPGGREAYPEEMYPEEMYPKEMYSEEMYAEEMYPQQNYDDGYYDEGYGDGYEHQEAYLEDYPDEDDYNIDMAEDDLDLLDDESYREEKKLRRIGRFRMAAGVMDFLGVIGGMITIFILIALLISLVNWLYADILQTFTILQTRL